VTVARAARGNSLTLDCGDFRSGTSSDTSACYDRAMDSRAAFACLGVMAVVLSSGPSASAAPAPAPAPAPAAIVVVHGLRGLVADVQVDSRLVLQGFAPARVTDPLSLAPGQHRIVVSRDSGGQTGPVVLNATVHLTAGSTTTAAVGLTAAGAPALFTYPPTSARPLADQGELVVRDIAAGPAVSVTQDVGVSQRVANGGEVSSPSHAGARQVQVQDAAGRMLLAPQTLSLPAGEVTTLYLTGSTSAGTLAWLVMSSPVGSPVIRVVPTGDGSVFGHQTGAGPGLLLAFAAAVGLSLRRRAASPGT